MIQEIRLSDLGDTSGVDGPSSTDCHSSSRASHLLYRGTWEGEGGKEGVCPVP